MGISCILLLARGFKILIAYALVALPTQTPEVFLAFSDEFRVAMANRQRRDLSKPYFFELLTPNQNPEFQSRLPFIADIGTAFDVWLDSNVSAPGRGPRSRSLAFKITSDKDENVKDKIMLSTIPHSSPLAAKVNKYDRVYHLSFKFRLDPSYEVPVQWAMHMQIWQCCGHPPPLTMSVNTGPDRHGAVSFKFGLRDDASLRRDGYPETTLYETAIDRDRWYSVAFQLHPTSDSEKDGGSIVMWIDGQRKFAYDGHWGYDPTQPAYKDADFSNLLDVDIGVYRRRQSTTQIIYFDEIRFDAFAR